MARSRDPIVTSVAGQPVPACREDESSMGLHGPPRPKLPKLNAGDAAGLRPAALPLVGYLLPSFHGLARRGTPLLGFGG
jgi:hypothetical protein